MARVTYTDGPYKSFEAVTATDLVGKEGYAVEITAAGKIQLYQAGVPIGVLVNRIEGSAAWNVHMFGSGGTMRCVSSGAIGAIPAVVKLAAGGTIVVAASTNAAIGVAIYPPVIASGDIVEVIDNPIAAP